jgi:diacylglycerol kinase (ATP)
VKLIILFNPAAGRGQSRQALAAALDVLRRGGVRTEIRESRSTEHLLELARQAREEEPDLVVSAGGDGTHHHVLNGLVGSEIPLGLIPLGTGNDFAKGIGVPRHAGAAAATLLQGKSRRIDVARAGHLVYGGMAGVGFDAMVARYVNERAPRARGRLAYFQAILHCLRLYRPQPLVIQSEGFSYSGEVMFAVIGNGSLYGGGFKLTPHARVDDGLLDVCLVPAIPKLELLRWAPRAYQGKHLAHPRIAYFQTRQIALTSPARLELFGDGEFMQELPATIEVAPRSLRVVVPPAEQTSASARSGSVPA